MASEQVSKSAAGIVPWTPRNSSLPKWRRCRKMLRRICLEIYFCWMTSWNLRDSSYLKRSCLIPRLWEGDPKKKQSIKTSTLCVFLKDSHLKCSNFFSNDSKTIIVSRSLFPQSSQSSRNLRTIMFRHSSCWNRRTNLLLNRGVDMHTIRQQNAWISEPLVPTKLGDFGSPFRGSEGEITIWKIRHYFVLDPNSDK